MNGKIKEIPIGWDSLCSTGLAARIAKVDKRTFISRARKMGVKPAGIIEGNRAVYLKDDVERVAKKIKEDREKNGR